ncbi:hypothetical protein QM012_002598 [Aureobasidium pullulans]|uniref:F-box domain-containing protein n=1 Tax=Aureobasidium pullulans TaxID=5580 RepID=A0ABR0TAX9_AURPU
MHTLSTLPPEIQLMILDYVDDSGLLTLNLTCRTIHNLLRPIIASTFGADRTFELSEAGMSALVRLSQDPITACHLKTLIIVHSGQRQPVQNHEILQGALQQLGTFGRLQSIGVRHATTKTTHFEPDIELAHNRIRKFLKKCLLNFALESGLPISNVIFEIDIQLDIPASGYYRRCWVPPSSIQDTFVTEFAAIRDTLNTLDTMSFPGVARTLRFVRKGAEGTRKSARMTYDPRQRSFYGSQLLADDWILARRWLATSLMLKTVTLLDCEVELLAFSNLMITPTLESISIKQALLFRDGSTRLRWRDGRIYGSHRRNDWVDVFDDLDERCPILSHCLLGRLRYNKARMCRKPVWEANNHGNVGQLLYDLSWSNRSRPEFKKENAPDADSRKPRKKAPRTKRIRFTHKKRKSSASVSSAQRSS